MLQASATFDAMAVGTPSSLFLRDKVQGSIVLYILRLSGKQPSLESFRPSSDVETSSKQASLEIARSASDVATSSKQAFLERFPESMCALLLVS